MQNDYGIEVTAAMQAKAAAALDLARRALKLWTEFEAEATGEAGTGNAGTTLEDACDDMEIDITRFTG